MNIAELARTVRLTRESVYKCMNLETFTGERVIAILSERGWSKEYDHPMGGGEIWHNGKQGNYKCSVMIPLNRTYGDYDSYMLNLVVCLATIFKTGELDILETFSAPVGSRIPGARRATAMKALTEGLSPQEALAATRIPGHFTEASGVPSELEFQERSCMMQYTESGRDSGHSICGSSERSITTDDDKVTCKGCIDGADEQYKDARGEEPPLPESAKKSLAEMALDQSTRRCDPRVTRWRIASMAEAQKIADKLNAGELVTSAMRPKSPGEAGSYEAGWAVQKLDGNWRVTGLGF
jgi:hypothetical protein